ncbi:hypothetical protein KM043_001299 [Ampulex compressa]|nr:hypothetical protein KM043_001299 [Ampulex compressa]
MLSRYRSTGCILGKYMQNALPVMLGPINCPVNLTQPVRTIKKHWDPKFKKLRKEKVIKVKLYKHEPDASPAPDQFRTNMRRMGLLPEHQLQEIQPLFCTSYEIFETYVPPEGDGKYSGLNKKVAGQTVELLKKKGKSYTAVKKIKSYDENFYTADFPLEAADIYLKAHEALAMKDKDTLLEYVTEAAYPEMIHNLMDKTIHWKLLESLEPARVVQIRANPFMTKGNYFGQVTVRFHTKQILCIYDRFGRVIEGSEILSKDVLEYIIFERHLSNEYGKWRLHGKITPPWMHIEKSVKKTYVKKIEKSTALKSTTNDVKKTEESTALKSTPIDVNKNIVINT